MTRGDVVYYNGQRVAVIAVSPGEYGDRVTVLLPCGAELTTGPLDHRLSLDGKPKPTLTSLLFGRVTS